MIIVKVEIAVYLCACKFRGYADLARYAATWKVFSPFQWKKHFTFLFVSPFPRTGTFARFCGTQCVTHAFRCQLFRSPTSQIKHFFKELIMQITRTSQAPRQAKENHNKWRRDNPVSCRRNSDVVGWGGGKMLNYTTRGFAVLDELVCAEYIIWWRERKNSLQQIRNFWGEIKREKKKHNVRLVLLRGRDVTVRTNHKYYIDGTCT